VLYIKRDAPKLDKAIKEREALSSNDSELHKAVQDLTTKVDAVDTMVKTIVFTGDDQ